jgi:hypothetical protein
MLGERLWSRAQSQRSSRLVALMSHVQDQLKETCQIVVTHHAHRGAPDRMICALPVLGLCSVHDRSYSAISS